MSIEVRAAARSAVAAGPRGPQRGPRRGPVWRTARRPAQHDRNGGQFGHGRGRGATRRLPDMPTIALPTVGDLLHFELAVAYEIFGNPPREAARAGTTSCSAGRGRCASAPSPWNPTTGWSTWPQPTP